MADLTNQPPEIASLIFQVAELEQEARARCSDMGDFGYMSHDLVLRAVPRIFTVEQMFESGEMPSLAQPSTEELQALKLGLEEVVADMGFFMREQMRDRVQDLDPAVKAYLAHPDVNDEGLSLMEDRFNALQAAQDNEKYADFIEFERAVSGLLDDPELGS